MDAVEARLKELGLELPPTPRPLAEYVPAKLVGDLVFVSGQGPVKDGKVAYAGKVGADLSLEEGYECARLCALNCLAAVKGVVGSLERVVEVVQLRGFVNSAPGFDRQPEVLNGASELMVKLFGEKGRHARAALGTCSLPRNIAVELEMVVRVR
jgi:enamine deaminase RidA (YjgF/YER057c/UK114 family)